MAKSLCQAAGIFDEISRNYLDKWTGRPEGPVAEVFDETYSMMSLYFSLALHQTQSHTCERVLCLSPMCIYHISLSQAVYGRSKVSGRSEGNHEGNQMYGTQACLSICHIFASISLLAPCTVSYSFLSVPHFTLSAGKAIARVAAETSRKFGLAEEKWRTGALFVFLSPA